jgi:DNA-directed RNA polymerase alpha subunit
MDNIIENEVPETSISAVMKQVSDALLKANSLITSYNAKLSAVNDREKALIDREAILQDQTNEFAKRASEVSKIENIVLIAKNAEQLSIDTRAKIEKLKADTSAFEDYKRSETQRLEDLRTITERESQGVIGQKAAIADEIKRQVSAVLATMGIKQ